MKATSLRLLAPAIALTAACGLASCSSDGDDEPLPTLPSARPITAAKTTTATLPSAACDETPESGEIDTTGYSLDYAGGSMKVSIQPFDTPAATCVGFAKSGNADPQVPPDSVLFTFSGDKGEGAQLEFLSVYLSRGILPWPGGTQTTPGPSFTSTVGVSRGGVFYTSNACTVTMAEVTTEKATGTFECPQAYQQTANPFDPSDDVSHDDDPTAENSAAESPTTAPKGAALNGVFELTRK